MLALIALFLDDKTMTEIFLGQLYQMTGYPILYPSPKSVVQCHLKRMYVYIILPYTILVLSILM